MKKIKPFWIYIAVNSALLLLFQIIVWIMMLNLQTRGASQIFVFFAMPLFMYGVTFMPLFHFIADIVLIAISNKQNMEKKELSKIYTTVILNMMLNIFSVPTIMVLMVSGMT
ncbi:MAG: hypothetical protein J1F04_09460 [Oscillospiraceae bacterium]|nr:hypothetical protein [Oscillospiraceae bacterium]